MCSSMPYLALQSCRYSEISARGANSWLHDAFSSNENEYRGDGTSQAHPGYWLSRQVPPRSVDFSRMTKSLRPAFFSAIPMPRPLNPLPTITILCRSSTTEPIYSSVTYRPSDDIRKTPAEEDRNGSVGAAGAGS